MNKSIDALKLALEALEQHGCPWIRHEKPYNEAITAIREALAHAPTEREQPAQQEPVAYLKTWHKDGVQHADIWQWEVGIEALKDGNHYLYTSPPANANAGKPWVGLTDEEVEKLIPPRDCWTYEVGHEEAATFARTIEAKLRERNEHREKNA